MLVELTGHLLYYPPTSFRREAMASHDNNPYAAALEGLRLDDPVMAFFDFCREREAIRLRRESGEPREKWTQDPVFQQGRFLNVFREDDRVTKAIFDFVRPLVDAAKKQPAGA